MAKKHGLAERFALIVINELAEQRAMLEKVIEGQIFEDARSGGPDPYEMIQTVKKSVSISTSEHRTRMLLQLRLPPEED